MGGCEYSISSTPNIFYCHIYGGPADNISCEQTINICPNDTVKFSLTYTCVPDGTTSSFQWKNHGFNISGATTDTYTILDTGLYSLTFFSTGSPGGGWITMGNIHAVCPTSGILEQTILQFHLYPNPASDRITIQSDDYKNTTIRIFNTLGEILSSSKLEGPIQDLDISYLENGVYIISFDTDHGISRQKVIKNAH